MAPFDFVEEEERDKTTDFRDCKPVYKAVSTKKVDRESINLPKPMENLSWLASTLSIKIPYELIIFICLTKGSTLREEPSWLSLPGETPWLTSPPAN